MSDVLHEFVEDNLEVLATAPEKATSTLVRPDLWRSEQTLFEQDSGHFYVLAFDLGADEQGEITGTCHLKRWHPDVGVLNAARVPILSEQRMMEMLAFLLVERKIPAPALDECRAMVQFITGPMQAMGVTLR
jgi:hypothetical protein